MAELIVLGEYEGPGEQKTAERLAAELPASWTVLANRRLPGADRDDVDLLVLGPKQLFVVEEKSWGPRVVVDDNEWYVGAAGHARMNPLNRVSQLARKIAGMLRDKVPGYSAVRGHQVVAAVVLSHDRLQLMAGPHHEPSEHVYPLEQAAEALQRLDAAEEGTGLSAVRGKVEGFLRGMPARPARPPHLGPYTVVGALDVPGAELAYEGEAVDGQRVVLKCYRRAALEQHGDPEHFLRRESAALNLLADSGRAWRVLPFFTAEDDTLFVVPLIPARERRHLVRSWSLPDPARPEGVLPERVARTVVADAFAALEEVHDSGLVHRALHPRRIWLGKGLRVLFSDFHLARISGELSVSLWAPDGDISEGYRAPECAASVGLAGASSDVFSLALSMSSWLLGRDASDMDVSSRRAALEDRYPWSVELVDITSAKDTERPTAAELAERFLPVAAIPDVFHPPSGVDIEVGALVHGRYRVDRQLGSGGSALSWLVYDEQIQAKKVLKAFREELSEDAQREYVSAHQLKHDRCARVYDMHVSESPHYLVSEYVEGTPLGALKPVPDVEGLRRISLDVLEALEYIHGKELVHGDVTPNNIIVGAGNEATLIDFGLSAPGGHRPHGTTPRFSAPELLDGFVTPSSDLYGLATSLIHAALGRDALVRDEMGPLQLSRLTDSERLQWGPEGEAFLEAVLQGAAERPADRPASARAFAELLRAARPVEKPAEATEYAVNPTVGALRRLYRASAAGNAGNRGLDDEFAKATYVTTLLDTSLVPKVLDGQVRIVLLTGNPGDGKTSFLAKLGDRLRDAGASVLEEDEAGWHLELGGRHFRAVYDASESHGDLSSDELVLRTLRPAQQAGDANTALVAVNDGRLRQFLIDHDEFEDLQFEVEAQQKGTGADPGVALVDLKRRSLGALDPDASLALRTMDSFTAAENWSVCRRCVAHEVCPMRNNATALRQDARPAFHELVLISHLRRRRRATFRDLRSAASWVITGDRTCEAVHDWVQRQRDPRFAESSLAHDLAFDPSSNDYLVQEWCDVDPSRVPAPGVDELRRSFDSTAVIGSPESLARAAYFGRSNDAMPSDELRAFRYLDEFTQMTTGADPDAARRRILLGMSRLVGAFGYVGRGLALSSNSRASDWSVLRVVPEDAFAVELPAASSSYVEVLPDAVLLRHLESGRSFSLTLDTAEVILRAADGELVDDAGSDAIRQEIDGFVQQLSREPSSEALVIDSAGTVSVARVEQSTIRLGVA